MTVRAAAPDAAANAPWLLEVDDLHVHFVTTRGVVRAVPAVECAPEFEAYLLVVRCDHDEAFGAFGGAGFLRSKEPWHAQDGGEGEHHKNAGEHTGRVTGETSRPRRDATCRGWK